LVKNDMDKLTFYAISSPEKLDRIGQYLEQRLSRDIHRHRIGYVITVDFLVSKTADKCLYFSPFKLNICVDNRQEWL